MKGETIMKANRYLLTVIVLTCAISMQAGNTLFGASGSNSSQASAANRQSNTMPAAKMRSTSTMMYQSGAAAPRAVYANPSQSVRFHVPNILNVARISSSRATLHNYGGTGAGVSFNPAEGRATIARRSSAGNASIGVISLPSLPERVKNVGASAAEQGGESGEQVMASIRSRYIMSKSSLTESAAEGYYTLYDAELQELAAKTPRRTRPNDYVDPFDEPIGDIPVALMALLAVGYALRVALRKKNDDLCTFVTK